MAIENLSRIVSDFETQVSVAAIAIGATSFKVQSVLDLDGETLSDGIYCFTIDRDSTANKEYLIGQLTTATKTVSSVSSVDRQGNLTANVQKAHRIGANVIISDHSILAAISRIFTGQGTINPAAPLEYDSAPTLSSATQLATKGYVDSVVTGGTVNSDRIIVGSQIAGETIALGDIIYFKSSDSRWWKADADDTATFQNVQLGVAQGAGTAGNTITDGVLIYGKCDSFTGLTATATYYLSNTAGGVSSSAGTNSIVLGQAFATTGIFFNPGLPTAFVTVSSGAADSGKGVKLNASGVLDSTLLSFEFGDGSDGDVTIAAGTTTLTRDMFYNNLVITGTLDTDGYRVFVKGTVSGAGTLKGVTGNNGTAGVVGANHQTKTGGAGATSSGSGPLKTVAGGKGGDTFLNAQGQTGTIGGSGGAGQTGKTGGNGGSGVDGAGIGGSGGVYGKGDAYKNALIASGFYITSAGALAPLTTPSSGGGGGGGSCDSGGSDDGGAGSGGGGGASGGTVMLICKKWTGTFTISSVGGNGGNGGASPSFLNAGGGGGGGGGNGGTAIIIYGTKTWTGSYSLTGGTGGTGGAGVLGGAGVNGTAGSAGVQLEIPAGYLI